MAGEITKDMLIGRIVAEYPEAANILMECGMHCLGCPASQMESLGDACRVHDLNADDVLQKLNAELR